MAEDNAEGYKMAIWCLRRCWSFICRGCMNPVTGTGCTSVDISVGDAELAVEARI